MPDGGTASRRPPAAPATILVTAALCPQPPTAAPAPTRAVPALRPARPAPLPITPPRAPPPADAAAARRPHARDPARAPAARPSGAPPGPRTPTADRAPHRWGARSPGGVRGRPVGCAVTRWGVQSPGEVRSRPDARGHRTVARRPTPAALCATRRPRGATHATAHPNCPLRTPSVGCAVAPWGAQSAGEVRSRPDARGRRTGARRQPGEISAPPPTRSRTLTAHLALHRWGARSPRGVRSRPVGCAVAVGRSRARPRPLRAAPCARTRPAAKRPKRCPTPDHAPQLPASHPVGGVRSRPVGCAVGRRGARSPGRVRGRPEGARSPSGVRGRPVGCAVGRRGARSAGGVRRDPVGCAGSARGAAGRSVAWGPALLLQLQEEVAALDLLHLADGQPRDRACLLAR